MMNYYKVNYETALLFKGGFALFTHAEKALLIFSEEASISVHIHLLLSLGC